MKKFGVYVSGQATRLKKFLKLCKQQEVLRQIKVVITDNVFDLELEELCLQLHISFYAFSLNEVLSPNKNLALSDFILNEFLSAKVDNGFIFGGRVLKGELLSQFHLKLINFHPSILPAFKGLHAIDQALAEHSFLVGNTAHFIVEEVDSGPIIMQNLLHSTAFKTYEQLLDQQLKMLYQIIDWINKDRLIIQGKYALVKDAVYSISDFIPGLEIDFSSGEG